MDIEDQRPEPDTSAKKEFIPTAFHHWLLDYLREQVFNNDIEKSVIKKPSAPTGTI
jgi:hypothetical protein